MELDAFDDCVGETDALKPVPDLRIDEEVDEGGDEEEVFVVVMPGADATNVENNRNR